MERIYDSKLSCCHFANQKTLNRARQRYRCPNVREDSEQKCENCTLYQARSNAGKKKIAPLQTMGYDKAADILGPRKAEQNTYPYWQTISKNTSFPLPWKRLLQKMLLEQLLAVCRFLGIEKTRTPPYHTWESLAWAS